MSGEKTEGVKDQTKTLGKSSQEGNSFSFELILHTHTHTYAFTWGLKDDEMLGGK